MWHLQQLMRRAAARCASSDGAYIALLAFLTAIIYFPLLFGGEMLSGDERVDGYYQYSAFYKDAIHTGESFLWNPYSYAGFPSFLNQFGSFLFPPVYIAFKYLPAIFAFHLVIAVATFAGLVFAYLFGRSFFLSRHASIILAISYCAAQVPGTFHLGLSYAHSFLVLPLLLLSIVGAKRASTKKRYLAYVALGCGAVAVGFLAGYFITFVYALIFAGIFSLFLDVFSASLGFTRGVRASVALVAMCFVGVLFGLPQLIPLYEYGPFTSRTAEFAQEMAVGSGVQLLDFVRFLLPYHFQFPLDPGRGYFYLGFIPFFAALASLFFFRDRIVRFFMGLFVFYLAFALNAPLFEWFNLHVPPFNHIGGVSRWLLVGVFALAYLAGYGFDRLRELRINPKFLRVWRFAEPVLFMYVGLVALIPFAIYHALYTSSIQWYAFTQILSLYGRTLESLRNPPEFYLEEIQLQLEWLYQMFSFQNVQFTIFIILTLLSIVLVRIYNRSGAAWCIPSLVSVACVTFVAGFVGGLGNTVSTTHFFSDIPVVVKIIRNRDSDLSNYRVISFTGGKLARDLRESTTTPTPEDTTLIMRELLYRETGSMYGVRNISGFEPIRPMRANQLIDAVLAPLADVVIDEDALAAGAPINTYMNTAILKDASEDEKAADIVRHLPLLSMMNVKYIVSLYPLEHKHLKEIPLETVPGLLVRPRLYENSTALPQVYFADNIVVWDDDDRELFLTMLEEENFSRKSYIECTGCQMGESSGHVSLVYSENGVLQATTTSSTGGWLIYTESHLPGWIATVDGKRVPIRTANYLFQGIEVPEGDHEIEFRYVGSFALFLEKLGLRKIDDSS